jgi:hypothetical protein
MAINPAGTFAYLTLSSDHTVAAFDQCRHRRIDAGGRRLSTRG